MLLTSNFILPVKQVLSSSLRYTCGKKSQGEVNMLKVTQVLSGGTRLNPDS